MPIHNSDIAGIFNTVADLLEIGGENAFRVRAYRNAGRTLGGLSGDIAEMVRRGEDFTQLPGIGKDLAAKIETIVHTGTLPMLEELKRKYSPELTSLMNIAGLGARRVKVLNQKLGINTIEELQQAAREQKIRGLPGFGAKTEEKILTETGRRQSSSQRTQINIAQQIAQPLVDYLKKSARVAPVAVAGSYRRRKETVRDLDVLVACKQSREVIQRFVAYDDVAEVVSMGETRVTVRLKSNLQVDLRVVDHKSYGAALHYFTGSQAHNIAIRKRGVKRGLKINEYGIYRGDRYIGGEKEEEIFAAVDLPYIEPELREDRGEVQAAEQGNLPNLVQRSDIRGDLHSHTNATDGRYTMEQMVDEARRRGYHYLAISDHSQRLAMAKGLNPARLARQIEQLHKLNQKIADFDILASIEVDILEDGSLDLPDSILRELDLVVCSVHSRFNLDREKQTTRIMHAMDNRYATILAHPTGRIIQGRAPYEIDMDRILRHAAETGMILELNSHPDRLDLPDIHCRAAKQLGIRFSIATDAHAVSDFDNLEYGIWQARRGWLEPSDVVNTLSIKQLRRVLQARR
ncbi:MAG: DNA polymerase/3'-5' exonuclease PolX [Chitinivibrionales bacterium]